MESLDIGVSPALGRNAVDVETAFMGRRFPFISSFFAFVIGVLGKVLFRLNTSFSTSKSLVAIDAQSEKKYVNTNLHVNKYAPSRQPESHLMEDLSSQVSLSFCHSPFMRKWLRKSSQNLVRVCDL